MINPNKIYLGNLPPSTSHSSLFTLFSPFGPIISIDILGDFGFIEYQRLESCTKALEIQGTILQNTPINVELSHASKRKAQPCYNCNEPGHLAKFCPYPRRAPQTPPVKRSNGESDGISPARTPSPLPMKSYSLSEVASPPSNHRNEHHHSQPYFSYQNHHHSYRNERNERNPSPEFNRRVKPSPTRYPRHTTTSRSEFEPYPQRYSPSSKSKSISRGRSPPRHHYTTRHSQPQPHYYDQSRQYSPPPHYSYDSQDKFYNEQRYTSRPLSPSRNPYPHSHPQHIPPNQQRGGYKGPPQNYNPNYSSYQRQERRRQEEHQDQVEKSPDKRPRTPLMPYSYTQ